MKRAFWIGLAMLLSVGAQARAEIYTIFSDKGFAPEAPTILTYSGCGPIEPSPFVSFDGQAGDIAPPEGFTSWKTTDAGSACSSSYSGMAAQFTTPQNLVRFTGGEIRFWIYTTTGKLQFNMQASGTSIFGVTLEPFIGTRYNQWLLIRLPFLSNTSGAVDLSGVTIPFQITATEGPAVFYIDNVRLVDSRSDSIFNVSVRNVAGNAPATEILWNEVALPGGWVVANQYLQLEVDAITPAWGVQIYTDNTASSANPKYTGTGNPAGLLDTLSPYRRLELAWSIRADTTTEVVAANPDNNSAWFYLFDRAGAGFVNGNTYSVIKNNQGIQFDYANFGSVQVPPNPIYLQADFSTAVTPRTYKTSALRVEFFTP